MDFILQARKLSKDFGSIKAVKSVSFDLQPGICFGLLGPNGAGKTTTIEMLEGLTEPSEGDIWYKGQIRDQTFKQEAGIQFQSTALMDNLTTIELLTLFAHFYKRTRPLSQLIQLCHLNDYLDQYAIRLSGGQRQRLLLALALVNDPDIVFLDEPTTGLDPQSRRNFWQLIHDIKREGKTIILTTHYMDEAQMLCDELAIMDHGEIIAQGSPNGLLSTHFDDICIYLDRKALDQAQFENNPQSLTIEYHQQEAIIYSQSVENTLQTLIKTGCDLSSLRIRNRNLDDLFLKLTGSHLRT